MRSQAIVELIESLATLDVGELAEVGAILTDEITEIKLGLASANDTPTELFYDFEAASHALSFVKARIVH